MGQAESGHREEVRLEDLRPTVLRWLEEKYQPTAIRGLGIAIGELLECLIEIHLSAVELGSLASETGFKGGVGVKGLADSVVHCVETIGLEWPQYTDYGTLRNILKTTKEASSLCNSVKNLIQDSKFKSEARAFTEAFNTFKYLQKRLSQAIDDLEDAIELTKPFTQEVEEVKFRILGPLSSALEDLSLLRQTLKIKKEYEEGAKRLEAAKHQAVSASGHASMQEGRDLKMSAMELAHQMDAMLAPFIRISQNIKGKDKLGESAGLSSKELDTIHKYTGVLTKPDVFGRLEGIEGKIEDFLEALFLLGIAGGVGGEATGKQSGLSKKSQAILADALNSFDADGFRTCYKEWVAKQARVKELEDKTDYFKQEDKAAAAVTGYKEAAKSLDRVSREWQKVSGNHERAASTFSSLKAHVEESCLREFGKSIDLKLPAEVLANPA